MSVLAEPPASRFEEAATLLRRLLADQVWMSLAEADETVDWIVKAVDDFPELERYVDLSALAAKLALTDRDDTVEAVAWRLTLACRIDPSNVEWPLRLIATGFDLLTPTAAATLIARVEGLRPSPAALSRAMDTVYLITDPDIRAQVLGYFAAWMPVGANLTALRLGEAAHELLSAEPDIGSRPAAKDVAFGVHLLSAREYIKRGSHAGRMCSLIDSEKLAKHLTNVRAALP